MTEPYFEPVMPTYDALSCPFGCHMQQSAGKGIAVDAHWHYYIEMLFSLSGKASVFLGGKCYSFNEGDLVLINAREVHSITADVGEDVKYIVVKFDPEVLYTTSRTVFESKYVLPFTMAKASPQKVFSKQEIEETPIPALLNEIYEEFGSKKYGFELAIRTHICRIFLWILRNWEKKGVSLDVVSHPLKENDMQMLQKVFDYLDQNYMQDVTAEAVARMCNLSYSYFSRQFKAIMGKTFTDYLNYIRITEAEKLLLTTDLNITQVALDTGFSNSSYFIQQFKHYKSISPKQFRHKAAARNSHESIRGDEAF